MAALVDHAGDLAEPHPQVLQLTRLAHDLLLVLQRDERGRATLALDRVAVGRVAADVAVVGGLGAAAVRHPLRYALALELGDEAEHAKEHF